MGCVGIMRLHGFSELVLDMFCDSIFGVCGIFGIASLIVIT